jgi:hypothetical protein
MLLTAHKDEGIVQARPSMLLGCWSLGSRMGPFHRDVTISPKAHHETGKQPLADEQVHEKPRHDDGLLVERAEEGSQHTLWPLCEYFRVFITHRRCQRKPRATSTPFHGIFHDSSHAALSYAAIHRPDRSLSEHTKFGAHSSEQLDPWIRG